MIKLKNMHIIWHGQFCFQIIVTRPKKEQVSILIDPFSKNIGLRVPKIEADILLVTHNNGYGDIKEGIGKSFLITNPGEYEIKEIFIQGIGGGTTIYTIEAEKMRLCHLGDLKQKELASWQIEKIGDIDILMIPVGGTYTISSREAPKIISQIDPKIVSPMHYQIPKLNLPAKKRLEGVDKFLKTMEKKSIESQDKLLTKKKDLPEDGMKIVVLRP